MEISDSEKVKIIIDRITNYSSKERINARALSYFLYEELIKPKEVDRLLKKD